MQTAPADGSAIEGDQAVFSENSTVEEDGREEDDDGEGEDGEEEVSSGDEKMLIIPHGDPDGSVVGPESQ